MKKREKSEMKSAKSAQHAQKHSQNALPELVHYFYFLSEEAEKIKDFWSRAVDNFNLKEDIGEKERIAKITYGMDYPTLLRAFSDEKSEVKAMVLFSEDIAVVVLFFFVSWHAAINKLNRFRERVRKELDEAFASTNIVISENVEEEFLKEASEYTFSTEFKACKLYQIAISEGETHFYVAKPKKLDYYFFATDFLKIDLLLHKIRREANFFRKQYEWAMGEREKADKEISEILHEQVFKKGNGDEMETLKKDMEKLSRIYTMLSSDLVLLKNAYKTLTTVLKEIESLTSAMIEREEKKTKEAKESIELLYLRPIKSLAVEVAKEEGNIRNSIKNAKTALDVIKSRIELIRSEEALALQEDTGKLMEQNIKIQEQGVSLQAAAGFIEFIILFYYSLASWLHLIGEQKFEEIPAMMRFFTILAFTTSAVIFTHFFAEAYKENWKFGRGFIISLLGILLSFATIVFITVSLGSGAGH